MIKIGIDYSLTSPAICIYKNDEYKFISFFDDYGKDWKKSKSKQYNYHRQLDEFMELIPYTRKIDTKDYRIEQITKMKSARMIADLIVEKLKQEIDNEDIIIGIEGFSYGSISQSTLDLALYNSFLRIKLLETFGEECVVIISPTEGKKILSGKGNAKKENMIEAFIKNNTNDDKIINNKFWQFCQSNELDFKYIKPIDDLVDSFGILKSI